MQKRCLKTSSPIKELKKPSIAKSNCTLAVGWTEIDRILMFTVEQVMRKYDSNGNGFLDKADLRRFVIETLSEIDDSNAYNEKDFQTIFKKLDKNGNGIVEKSEMFEFIKDSQSF